MSFTNEKLRFREGKGLSKVTQLVNCEARTKLRSVFLFSDEWNLGGPGASLVLGKCAAPSRTPSPAGQLSSQCQETKKGRKEGTWQWRGRWQDAGTRGRAEA